MKQAMRYAVMGVALVAGLAAVLAQLAPARAEPQASAARLTVDEICHTLAEAAADNELPEEFFTRLIWQESRFDPLAVSPVGAQGIAQFMPQTAKMRGLTNAFEPLQALRESASYLRELRTTFRGNLGLAAAAYNAGPGQVEAWLAKRSALPGETWAYVLIVTGQSADAWASSSPPAAPAAPSAEPSEGAKGARCVEIAKLMIERTHRRRPPLTDDPAWGPWGVQLAGNWTETGVLAAYERLRRKYSAVLGDRLPLVLDGRRKAASPYLVRVSEESRQAANTLCAKLTAAGGACIVLRNPRD
jgi:Transglycosylase SLT domain/SPOR domain